MCPSISDTKSSPGPSVGQSSSCWQETLPDTRASTSGFRSALEVCSGTTWATLNTNTPTLGREHLQSFANPGFGSSSPDQSSEVLRSPQCQSKELRDPHTPGSWCPPPPQLPPEQAQEPELVLELKFLQLGAQHFQKEVGNHELMHLYRISHLQISSFPPWGCAAVTKMAQGKLTQQQVSQEVSLPWSRPSLLFILWQQHPLGSSLM